MLCASGGHESCRVHQEAMSHAVCVRTPQVMLCASGGHESCHVHH